MDTLTITIIVLALGMITLFIVCIRLNKRISQLIRGHSNNSNLENIIVENNHSLIAFGERVQKLEKSVQSLKKDSEYNIQHIGVIRFNPFKETGGSQSFAIALTDKLHNGVVISSLYARERVNVFAKPIVNGISEYQLTKEEQAALNQSQKSL